MPTLQMVFRMSNKGVADSGDYLTGAAHPAVFEGAHIQADRMAAMAHALTVDHLPPVVRMKVVEDDSSLPGRDYFDGAARQELFTTPSAIARVHRTSRYEYRMVVSAEESVDLGGRPLTYHWKILRGDEKLIEIKPRNDSGSVVELVVPMHGKVPITPGAKLQSSRVDIGCFVHNGDHYSAPGFVTFYSLANQRRHYHPNRKPAWITYGSADEYVDPMVDAGKSWKDTYEYDDAGELIGWTRERGDATESFTHDGALIASRDDKGRALTARTVTYAAEQRGPQELPSIAQHAGDELLHYEYASPEDKIGRVVRREKIAD
jgi:hypothetical protein